MFAIISYPVVLFDLAIARKVLFASSGFYYHNLLTASGFSYSNLLAASGFIIVICWQLGGENPFVGGDSSQSSTVEKLHHFCEQLDQVSCVSAVSTVLCVSVCVCVMPFETK